MIKRSFNAEPNAKLSDFFYYNMLQIYWIPIGILLCDGQRAVALTTSRSQVAMRDAVVDDYVMSVYQISLLKLKQGKFGGVFQVPSNNACQLQEIIAERAVYQISRGQVPWDCFCTTYPVIAMYFQLHMS